MSLTPEQTEAIVNDLDRPDVDRVLAILYEDAATVAEIAERLDWPHRRVRTALLAAEEQGLAHR